MSEMKVDGKEDRNRNMDYVCVFPGYFTSSHLSSYLFVRSLVCFTLLYFTLLYSTLFLIL